MTLFKKLLNARNHYFERWDETSIAQKKKKKKKTATADIMTKIVFFFLLNIYLLMFSVFRTERAHKIN